MSKDSQDPVVQAILRTSLEAAGQLRKEQGFLNRFMSWLEKRSESKHQMEVERREMARKDTAAARCRENKHDIQNWNVGQRTKVYAEGTNDKNSLPVHHRVSWTGHCIHCGAPGVMIKNV